MKNQSVTKLDTAQVVKKVFNEQHDAVRVINACDVETEFSLNHEDGDSIVCKSLSVVIPANTEVDASNLSKVQAYEDGFVTLFATDEMQVDLPVKNGQILEICAIKLSSTVVLIGR